MQRLRKLGRVCGVALIAFLSLGLLQGGAYAQTTPSLSNPQNVPEPQTFGAWIKFCTLPTGTPTVLCELMQSARTKDRPDIPSALLFSKMNNQKNLPCCG